MGDIMQEYLRYILKNNLVIDFWENTEEKGTYDMQVFRKGNEERMFFISKPIYHIECIRAEIIPQLEELSMDIVDEMFALYFNDCIDYKRISLTIRMFTAIERVQNRINKKEN